MPPSTVWTADEQAWLREQAGSGPVRELVERFAAQFGYRRSYGAMLCRARLLGLSLVWQTFSLNRVVKLFGVHHDTALHHWVEPGLLVGQQSQYRFGCHGRWIVTARALEAFIRQHSHAYDWHAMPPGRWRAMAELVAREHHWLTAQQAARLAGVKERTFYQWLKDGRVPARQMFEQRESQPTEGRRRAGIWRIRRADALAARARVQGELERVG